MTTSLYLRALHGIEKRAERVADEHVVNTYVETGTLVDALESPDNGVVFGRRGTGKTHALKYLAGKERDRGSFVVYVDIEQDLGSTEGIYGDRSLPLSERATRLLIDVLNIIHERLLADAFEGRADVDPLDRLLDHFGQVMVVSEAEREESEGQAHSESGAAGVSAGISGNGPRLDLTLGEQSFAESAWGARTRTAGPVRHRVHFGAVSGLIRKALSSHVSDRCWLLFDEWSGLPPDLQPYLAEMLRRLFFGLPNVTVRVGAIPHRTEWRLIKEDGGYIGLEIGAEIFPLLDLDEFVVFPAKSREEQKQRATEFFKTLLYRHIVHVLTEAGEEPPESPDEFVRLAFTQVTALQEVVRAAEGVPRDALNIVSRAALRAGQERISTDHVRRAAAEVFQTTKQALVSATPAARTLLDIIVNEVISEKKARAFLLAQDETNHPLIQRLIDDRILHLIKKGYSSKDRPGERFDVLQIDYGCYVQLLQTNAAPEGLFGSDGPHDDAAMAAIFESIEVPEDDYRAIRRAILDLSEHLSRLTPDSGS